MVTHRLKTLQGWSHCHAVEKYETCIVDCFCTLQTFLNHLNLQSKAEPAEIFLSEQARVCRALLPDHCEHPGRGLLPMWENMSIRPAHTDAEQLIPLMQRRRFAGEGWGQSVHGNAGPTSFPGMRSMCPAPLQSETLDGSHSTMTAQTSPPSHPIRFHLLYIWRMWLREDNRCSKKRGISFYFFPPPCSSCFQVTKKHPFQWKSCGKLKVNENPAFSSSVWLFIVHIQWPECLRDLQQTAGCSHSSMTKRESWQTMESSFFCLENITISKISSLHWPKPTVMTSMVVMTTRGEQMTTSCCML